MLGEGRAEDTNRNMGLLWHKMLESTGVLWDVLRRKEINWFWGAAEDSQEAWLFRRPMGLFQGQLLSRRGGCCSKHWVSCQSRVHIPCSKINSTNCPGHELKDTDLGGGVYSTRHLSKVSLIGTLGLVLFVANRLSPLWPFIWIQQSHPEFFSLTSFFQFRNSSLWPCFIRDNFSSVVLGWARTAQFSSESAWQPKHWFRTTCFQNTLFVYLTAVFALLCTTGRIGAKIPRATCFIKCFLSEAFPKWTKARSQETFRLLLKAAWITPCNNSY